MKRWYITFSGQAWDATTERIVRDGPRFGADEVLVYDDRWLQMTEFYRVNEWLWNTPRHRGFGWFCWKPFILLHWLEHFAAPGDLALYTDADTYPIADFSALYSRAIADGGAMFFKAQGCANSQWVKGDCWQVMGLHYGPERPEWMPAPVSLLSDHATARFIVIEAGPWKPRQILIEWLAYCLNPYATTFERSELAPDPPGFVEHRTEQAIMTLLALKCGFKLYREACQFGDPKVHKEDTELYPQLFVQEWGKGSRQVGQGSRYRNVEAALAQLRNTRV